MFFPKVTILGVGLLGASFALALKEKGLCGTVWGCGRNEDNLKRAQARGIIDAYRMEASEACQNADMVMLATPVGVFAQRIGEIRGSLKNGSLVTDVGSVKGALVYQIETLMPDGILYVGSHPIAGGDRPGIEDARADLFRDARCIVTPTENSDQNAKGLIVSLWEQLGGRVEVMEPYAHDRIYAAVSHFPHVIAYALVNAVNDFSEGCIEYAGKGFRDATRIAMSSPELWRDISVFNRDNLLRVSETVRENLDRIERLIEAGDAAGIEAEFTRARLLRMKIESQE
jgi:prephenate dehydrogenase